MTNSAQKMMEILHDLERIVQTHGNIHFFAGHEIYLEPALGLDKSYCEKMQPVFREKLQGLLKKEPILVTSGTKTFLEDCLHCRFGDLNKRVKYSFWKAFLECLEKHGLDKGMIVWAIHLRKERGDNPCGIHHPISILRVIAEALDQRPDQP